MAVLTNALIDKMGAQPSAPTMELHVEVTPSAVNYNSGGEPFDAEALFQTLGGLDKAPAEIFFSHEPKGNFALQYDRAAKKLLYFLISTGAEAGAIDLSTTPGVMKVKLSAR